jgi:DNA repair photolyase
MSRTILGSRPLKGRGALSNPAGRFETRNVEEADDGWYADEQPESIATTVEPDRCRSIISTNDSPDIPFEYSINPYRGCEHGCIYCVGGDTQILMADGTLTPMADIRVGDHIYGTVRQGWYRRYVKTQVLAHWSVIKPAYRITLEDGTELVAGADHRFLTDRGWKFVTGSESGTSRRPHLTTGNKLMGVGAFAVAPTTDADYRMGYLCGLIRGDGMLDEYCYPRKDRGQNRLIQFRLALCDLEALDRAQAWLQDVRVETTRFEFSGGPASRLPMNAIRAQSRLNVERVRQQIAWPAVPSQSWKAGFLAGIFDAEGSFSGGILRISNTDPEIIGFIGESLKAFNFKFRIEHVPRAPTKPIDVVRLLGGLKEHLRFFHTVDPAIRRKRDFSSQAVKSAARLNVKSIQPVGSAMRLYDITTGTEDFIANGVVSHNCYARPSHGYLGLSAGIDFETRLFYKADAGKLLEAELARPGYVCKPITIGANTDPYQPVERDLRVTRQILEVLAQTRHPLTIISKSALVLRDLDLLKDLARENLVSVAISITTLSAETKRSLEPRTASPSARLRAVHALSEAGIPVTVMVAPVIPAITDHEMEDILAASRDAGARRAGYIVLRLPHEVNDLFQDWLKQHFPDRASHVMSLIRDMRGGRDNDPRFGSRMRGTGPIAQLLQGRFRVACSRLGLNAGGRGIPPNTQLFRPPAVQGSQLSLGF